MRGVRKDIAPLTRRPTARTADAHGHQGVQVTTILIDGRTRRCDVLDGDVDFVRDRGLTRRAQDGDRSAFAELYVRYHGRIYRFCLRRLRDRHEAEDVTQEVFARAWCALPSFAGDQRFFPWVRVIAAHLCTDVLRRRTRSTPVGEFHHRDVVSTDDGGEERVVDAVDAALVGRALHRLSDRHRRILHLREGRGWSNQRIADYEGVGIGAVETLLWRARSALRREFELACPRMPVSSLWVSPGGETAPRNGSATPVGVAATAASPQEATSPEL